MNNIDIQYTAQPEAGSLIKIEIHLQGENLHYIEVDNCHFQDIYQYTKETTSVAFEFYLLSTLIYNIDKLLPRKKYSLDGWCREIAFKYEVNNPILWNSCKTELCDMLSFLTGDQWDIIFEQKSSRTYYTEVSDNRVNEFKPSIVCLFSGGLDSLAGAYALLSSNTKTLLVSHYDIDMNGPNSDQENIVKTLTAKFQYGKDFSRVANRVGAVRGHGLTLETTFRSRSILFIGIASYIAHNITPSKAFYIPENGTISLNIPLSPSRRSSCSTKTTHPHVLLSINNIFNKLGINTTVINPYELKTKGEMLTQFKNDAFFLNLVKLSNSCGKSGHKRWWYNNIEKLELSENPKHCGKCMPCIYRRAAMHRAMWDDAKFYGDNIFDKKHWDTLNTPKHTRYKDVKTFLRFMGRQMSLDEIKKELLVNGSLPLDKLDGYANVVVKTIDEIKTWMNDHNGDSNYPEIKKRAKL